MKIRRIAILAMNPWSAPGAFQPFSYGAYRNATAVVADHALGDIDVRVLDTHGWMFDRWVNEVLAYDPDVVACSAYVWSTPTFYTLAVELRARAPHIKIVFGGPSARPELFALSPYPAATKCIDALVVGEGEASFPDLIRAWRAGRSAASVAGLAVPNGPIFTKTAARDPIADLDTIPTPHQYGLAPIGVTAHLEPFRGCPMSCMFCQWGVQDGRRAMSAEAVKKELRAFKESKATGLYLVDAGLNLNKRAFKALWEAEQEIGFIRDTELTCEVYPAFLEEPHLELLRSTRAHVGLGLQSLDGSLLENLHRPFDRMKFEKVVASVSDAAQTTIELIVGLPGDSPEQFRRTFEQVRTLPCSLRVYHCLVLPDALLTRAPPEYKLDFDPITLEMRSCLGWTKEDLLRTFDFLTEEAEKHGGRWTRYFPREVAAGDLSYHLGQPVGSSMWLFPHHEHEDWHRKHRQRGSGFVTEFAPSRPAVHVTRLEPNSRVARLVQRVAERSTEGSWQVREIGTSEKQMRVEVESGPTAFAVCFADANTRTESYVSKDGLAFWHEGMPDNERDKLDAFIELISAASSRVDLFQPSSKLRVVT